MGHSEVMSSFFHERLLAAFRWYNPFHMPVFVTKILGDGQGILILTHAKHAVLV